MHKLILLLVLLNLTCILGCRKEKIDNTLTGRWELRSTAGGYNMPHTYTPGNGTILKFEDDKYYRYSNGQLVKSGTYTLVEGRSFDNRRMNQIIYDGDTSFPTKFLEIRKGKLIIYLGAHISLDGAVVQYEKL
ncbi:MAG: hypothetical protein M3Q05_12945 [Bacteroidota bacterium]|nr:hypothetical protein [Bacteroidota bacterium]